jgi:hypothetical protein
MDKKTKLWMWTTLWSIPGAFLTLFGLLAMGANGGQGPGLLMIAVGVGPLIFLITRFQRLKTNGQAEFDADARGMQAAHQLWVDGTGIAIAPARKELLLASGPIRRKYVFGQVREFSTSKRTPDQIIGGGTVGGMANVAAAVRAQQGSGLFIWVKDIDHPEWRVAMLKTTDQQRWYEILQQNLSD